jgi:hypothetical protein
MPSVGRGRGGTLEQQIRGSRDLDPDVALSKKLAHTLRHNAAKEGESVSTTRVVMLVQVNLTGALFASRPQAPARWLHNDLRTSSA